MTAATTTNAEPDEYPTVGDELLVYVQPNERHPWGGAGTVAHHGEVRAADPTAGVIVLGNDHTARLVVCRLGDDPPTALFARGTALEGARPVGEVETVVAGAWNRQKRRRSA